MEHRIWIICCACLLMVGPAHSQFGNGTSGDNFYSHLHQQILEDQLQHCDTYNLAHNGLLAHHCSEVAQNAHDWLLWHSEHGTAPSEAWMACAPTIESDLALGARCIAAGEDICQMDANRSVSNRQECLQVMATSAWVTNPKAEALDFDKPRDLVESPSAPPPRKTEIIGAPPHPGYVWFPGYYRLVSKHRLSMGGGLLA